MVKKKVDSRVRTLIENGVAERHRSMFVLVGDKGRDQVVNLHYMLSKASVRARPSVLWCYKKELGFTTHRQKRMRELKRKMKAGIIDADKSDPFELFISATDIRYCYYSETQKILGNTYGMLVLQDFEAVTPNLLARTIETVEGGGIVVVLMRTVRSLKQLYTMTMDVHARFRTAAHQHVVPRFNERFLLSLKAMPSCLMLDDALDILPWARQTLRLEPVAPSTEPDANEVALKELKVSLADTQPAGALVAKAVTMDQATCLLKFIEAISEKTLRSTVTLTAARGRGKSALLGLSIAAAVGYGYSNVFITAPSPENLKTVFDFVFKGFDALSYVEHTDYEIIQSSNPDFNKAVVRVNVFQQDHRQTIQYIAPEDAAKLGQCELLVIDEAAAIPLPLVKGLLGPYLVFMASTVNGYEGTGRSLSLKLISQLRRDSAAMGSQSGDKEATSVSGMGNRVLRELTLETPIRYAPGDAVETWLNQLLCLDSTVVSRVGSGCPHPDKCELYTVDRDTLFSYNPVAEKFLQRVMSLYVSSHYKNTPNDLQLLSDAPAHRVFCLLGPVDPGAASLPEILCVVQVALEGEISRDIVRSALREGARQSGDLIPWTVSQQFQDPEFGQLSGARVVRIATHPDYQGMGYGARALDQLCRYYQGNLTSLSETAGKGSKKAGGAIPDDAVLAPRTKLPPLLSKLAESSPEPLDYLGVSYGATPQLQKFWKRAGFSPVYLRQTANDLTGEHTCIMLKPLEGARASPAWCTVYWKDFQRRFLSLLGYSFRHFEPTLALGLLERSKSAPLSAADGTAKTAPLTAPEMYQALTPYDLKRLHSYAKNMVDFHVITDLLPGIAKMWFTGKLPVTLSALQKAILVGVGLQHKTVEEVAASLGGSVSTSHILGLFSQMMRKLSKFFKQVQEEDVSQSLPQQEAPLFEPMDQSLDDAQKQAATEAMAKASAVDVSEFAEFAVDIDEADLKKAGSAPSTISQKRKAGKGEAKEAEQTPSKAKKKKKKGGSSRRQSKQA